MLNSFNTILWDFDGVILDSMAVRDWGFKEIFKEFSKENIDALLKYHRDNGGLSRYVKIRYFYEDILNEQISDEKVLEYAQHFSTLMKQELTDPKNLILDSVNFIKKNYTKYNFHIVSGSDQNELKYLCKMLGISSFFKTIYGSPTPKNKLVQNVLNENSYKIEDCCLIGDSYNDADAASNNLIKFFAYNNPKLGSDYSYIENFKHLILS